jgi:hypothetical protein
LNLHNQIKYGTDFLRGFSRAFGLAEDEEGPVRLGETVTPIANLFDRNRPEWAYLRQEKIFVARLVAAAGGAGVRSEVGIFNPAGSRMITVLKWIYPETASFIVAQPLFGLQANHTVSQAVVIDARWVPTGAVPNQARTQRTVKVLGAATPVAVMWNPTNALIQPHLFEIVLPPNFHLVIQATADNAAIQEVLVGYERPAMPGELQG